MEEDQLDNIKNSEVIDFLGEFEKALYTDKKPIGKTSQKLIQIQDEHAKEIETLRTNNKKLLAIIAHDIKSPMSSILGFLTILKDRIARLDRGEIERHIDIALLSAKKTFTLLDNLLEWAFSENKIKSFQQEEIDLNELLLEELKNINLFASSKQIRIESNSISHEQVFIDINMIRTVFRNLLNNAIKYTHKEGEIVICTKKNNGFIEVSIKDNGIGMKQEIQDLIFSDSSYNSRLGTGNEPGTGFGLLLCKEFIDFHGGKIWIISEPGNGSEISFTLPVKTSKKV
ncbi:MAG: HAMP domain-containing histidine kinase [Bacteroidales bacterium]|nr:HAMP domain-containing histidine kinase [Bacteroidales bacterium]